MADPAPANDEQKTAQGGEPIAFSAEGQLNEDNSVSNQTSTTPTNNHSSPLPHPSRIGENLSRWWVFIKNPDFTNPAIAIATIAIAVATCFSWYEVHEGGKQTDKIVIASMRIQTDLDTQNKQSQAALDKTLRENRRALRRNLRQGQGAMDASNTQSSLALNANINASKLDQRAWVGVSDAIGKGFDETKGLTAIIVFFNSGKTPARNVKTSAAFTTSTVPLSGPSAEEIKSLEFRSVQAIAPQGRYNQVLGQIIAGEPLTESEVLGGKALLSNFQAIKDQKAVLYLYGILKYDDVFGGHRETHYCVFLSNPATKEMAYCDGFNDVN